MQMKKPYHDDFTNYYDVLCYDCIFIYMEHITDKPKDNIWEERNLTETVKNCLSNTESEQSVIMKNTKREYVKSEWTSIGKKSGIYLIINKLNGKYYVGSSKNINYGSTCRWRRHITALNDNYHDNDYLQRAWNKYGSEAFVFIILEEIESVKDKLLYHEQKYIDIMDRYMSYNIAPLAKGGEILKDGINCAIGRKHSETTKQCMRIAALKRGVSDEDKKRLSDFMIQMNKTRKGTWHHSEETRRKISESNKGKKRSEEQINKNRLANLGKKHTEEWKVNMSILLSGNKNPSYDTKIYTFNNVKTRELFTGTRHEFAFKFGYKNSTVNSLVNGGIVCNRDGWTIKTQTSHL
jgi:group I intron endonuclease